MSTRTPNEHQQGFTLLEVLFALVILAVAAGGLLTAARHSLSQQQALESRVFASWVAENKMAELRSARAWLDADSMEEHVTLAGQEWNIRVVTEMTENTAIQKIQVRVSDNGSLKQSPYILTGFLGRH